MPGSGDINLRVQIDGVDELMQGFQRISSNLQPMMQQLEERIKQRLTTYPPERPGQTYMRTGALGEAWAVSVDARGTNLYQDRVSVEMSNDVQGPDGRHYAAWVQSPEQQASIHRGRWTTTQQAVDEETPLFLDDLATSIERGWAAH